MNTKWISSIRVFVLIFVICPNLVFAGMIELIPGQTYQQWVEGQRKQAAKECPSYKNMDQKGKNQTGSAYNLDVQRNMGLHLSADEKAVLERVYQNKMDAENRLSKSGELKSRPNKSISVTDYLPKFDFFAYCNCTQGEIVNSITKELFESNGTDGMKAKVIHNERCLLKEAKR